VVTDLAISANTVTAPSFAVPVGAPQGTAPVRCRISSQSGLGVTGAAPDGEVEDHPALVGVAQPRIGIAKRLVSVERDPAMLGAYNVVFEVRLVNLGNVPLTNVNATGNFAAVFPAPITFTVTSLTSTDFTVNPAFNGSGNNDFLAAGNTLDVAEAGVLQVTLHVVANGNHGPFTCSSTARGTAPDGSTVTDVSQNGGNPDPDSDGDAGDNNDPTVFSLPFSVVEIPTLGTWGLLLLMALLSIFAIRRLRAV